MDRVDMSRDSPHGGGRAARRRNGPFGRFRTCCSRPRWGRGCFSMAGLAEASYKNRIGSANSPDASARRPYLWGGERDKKTV